MSSVLAYADSSALVKLVVAEPETAALLAWIGDRAELVSSRVAAVEVVRAARRCSSSPEVVRRAEAVVAAVHLLELDTLVVDGAARLPPSALRSLDAIHLASALSLTAEIDTFLVYDARLEAAAREHGLPVVSPR